MIFPKGDECCNSNLQQELTYHIKEILLQHNEGAGTEVSAIENVSCPWVTIISSQKTNLTKIFRLQATKDIVNSLFQLGSQRRSCSFWNLIHRNVLQKQPY